MSKIKDVLYEIKKLENYFKDMNNVEKLIVSSEFVKTLGLTDYDKENKEQRKMD